MQSDVEQVPADPWAVAFAALDKEEAEGAAEAAPKQGSGDEAAQGADAGANPDEPHESHQAGPDGGDGGVDLDAGNDDVQDAEGDRDVFGISQEELDSYRSAAIEEVTNQAINDVARAYINKGARHHNGVLGATIDDKDICKRDDDGVPHFYNPDTGREFTGDNPRRQAQEWVDDYNRSLAQAFNNTCEGYSKKLMEEREPQFKTLEFSSTYDGLDPVRQIMFDQIIEGHEVYDSDGDLVGYDCDLNFALQKVNNTVRHMQEHFKAHQTQTPAAAAQDAGPALDMRSSAGSSSDKPPRFNSIAEAMEWQQDQLIAKMRSK